MAYTGDMDDDDEFSSSNSKVKVEDSEEEGVHKKDDNDDSDDYKMDSVQKGAKMTMYSDANWSNETLFKNRELEVKYARKHNQHQLQWAIEKVKRGTNQYLRDLFTYIDPAGNYTNYVPHLNKLKFTPPP